MEIHIHPHALERIEERYATIEEVKKTIEHGESFPAKFGRTGFRRNFSFNNYFRGKHYQTKQIEAYAVYNASECLVITVLTKFF